MAGNTNRDTDMRDNIYASTQHTFHTDYYRHFQHLEPLRENEFEWIVPNFLEIRHLPDACDSVLSPEFELEDGESSFQFQLFRNGETNRNENAVGLFLRLNGCSVSWSFVGTQFHVAVINYIDWRRSIFRHGTFNFTHEEDNVGWHEFITLEQVATNQFWSPSGEMRIRGSVRLDGCTPFACVPTDSPGVGQYEYANLKDTATTILKLIEDNQNLRKTITVLNIEHEKVVTLSNSRLQKLKDYERLLGDRSKKLEQTVKQSKETEELFKEKCNSLEMTEKKLKKQADILSEAENKIKSQGSKIDKDTKTLNAIKAQTGDCVDAVEETATCKICMDAKIQTSFRPCGHTVACRACAKLTLASTGRQCPYCKERVDSVADVIIP